jgi:predicted  nucleic acid-binding Zn-ribbon protein
MKLEVTRTNLVLFAIVVGLLIYSIAFAPNRNGVKYIKPQHELDSLAHVITDLKREQHAKDSVITNLKSEVSALDKVIYNQKVKIVKIREEYDTKIKTVSNYTPSELDSFFAERYK